MANNQLKKWIKKRKGKRGNKKKFAALSPETEGKNIAK